MKKLLCVLATALGLSLAMSVLSVLGAATIADFRVEASDGGILVYWETASESGNLGFYLWRSESPEGAYAKLPVGGPAQEQFIPSEDVGLGAMYEYIDTLVTPGVLYYYQVQDVPSDGSTGEFVGPEAAGVDLTPDPTTSPSPSPVVCTLEIATTDRAPFGNRSFETAASIANYTDQALVEGDQNEQVEAWEDFYRLDNASIGHSYTVQAKPDRTLNYNLGIIVYDRDRVPVITDTNTYDDNFASVTLVAENTGPYYFKVFQISQRCTGHTYSLILGTTAPPSTSPVTPPSQTVCTLEITTTDTAPFNNRSFDTAASIANYTDQALLEGDEGDRVETWEDFYRLDSASIGYRYTVQAKPDRTLNYNLGIIVYNRDRVPIITDTNTFDDNFASVSLTAENFGPYYFKVFQISEQCSGHTYSLILEITAPTPTPAPPQIHQVYLPIVTRRMIPSPLEVGTRMSFSGAWYDVPLEALVTGSECRDVLYNHGEPVEADGTYVIALVDLTNQGLRSDEIGRYGSLAVQDNAGRIFDLASLVVHQAAEETYGRKSLYYPIQPGVTVPLVLVFDVFPGSEDLQLISLGL